jgi:Mg-chelatase subunit ChlD
MSEYLCPITKDIMSNPVSDENGHTFDKHAIEQWMAKNSTSPMTNKKYKSKKLKPNWSMKSLIESLSDVDRHNIINNISNISKKRQKVNQDDWDIVNDDVVEVNTRSITNGTNGTINNTMFSIKSNKIKNGKAVDLVLLVDRSGSMVTDVSAKDIDGNSLENGLTSMCIVKHALKTIVNMLDSNDRVSIVLYDNVNTILCNLVVPDDQETKNLMVQIEAIQPTGSTNIYGAIECAIDIISKRTNKSRNSSIILLTDGQANQSPSQGEVSATRSCLKKNNVQVPIHTFAFGNGANSKLLYDIANISSGMFCFIPDGGMVGTTFVNAVSNIKCISANESSILVEPLNGASMGSNNYGTGFILHDQDRHLVVRFDLSNHKTGTEYCKYFFRYNNNGNDEAVNGTCRVSENDESVLVEQYRLHVIKGLHKLIKSSHNLRLCNEIIDDLVNQSLNDAKSEKLLENINDQVRVAFSEKEYVRTWSLHYIRSLVRSLELEIKSNFKDPALSVYTNDLFNEICAYGDTIFNNLEPPKPKKIKRDNYGVSMTSATQSMHTYNRSDNPCFDGNSLIRMSDDIVKPVKELVKGSKVWTPTGIASVRCILETRCKDGKGELVKIGSMLITPYHPVKHKGVWMFPKDVHKPEIRECESVFSLLLDSGHIVNVEGHDVICLGHNFHKPKILEHDYFGSFRVVEDLQTMPGFSEGHVVLRTGCIVDDGNGSVKFEYNNN